MKYKFQYLNPSRFSSINNEFKTIEKTSVSQGNAKKIGVICLRAIREYEKVKEKYQAEKRTLKVWVREQRKDARNHGSIIKYKGASKTRASINTTISNINDEVLNKIDLTYDEARINLPYANNKLNECLQFYSEKDIKEYEKTYINEQKKIQEYKDSISEKRIWIVSIVCCFLFIPIAIWWGIIIFWSIICVGLITISLIRIRELNKFIQQEREKIQQAQGNIQALKEEREQRKQEREAFDTELSEEELTEKNKNSDDLDEYPIAKELAEQLEKEYYFLENACLSYSIDANTWLDLAEKIQSKPHYLDNDQHGSKDIEEEESNKLREPYTVDWLKANFDSFQVAKDYFGIKARGWETLAEYLNEEK